MGSFRGVNLKASLVDQVEEVIKDFPYWKNIPEFVSEAIRLRLEAFGRLTKKEAS